MKSPIPPPSSPPPSTPPPPVPSTPRRSSRQLSLKYIEADRRRSLGNTLASPRSQPRRASATTAVSRRPFESSSSEIAAPQIATTIDASFPTGWTSSELSYASSSRMRSQSDLSQSSAADSADERSSVSTDRLAVMTEADYSQPSSPSQEKVNGKDDLEQYEQQQQQQQSLVQSVFTTFQSLWQPETAAQEEEGDQDQDADADADALQGEALVAFPPQILDEDAFDLFRFPLPPSSNSSLRTRTDSAGLPRREETSGDSASTTQLPARLAQTRQETRRSVPRNSTEAPKRLPSLASLLRATTAESSQPFPRIVSPERLPKSRSNSKPSFASLSDMADRAPTPSSNSRASKRFVGSLGQSRVKNTSQGSMETASSLPNGAPPVPSNVTLNGTSALKETHSNSDIPEEDDSPYEHSDDETELPHSAVNGKTSQGLAANQAAVGRIRVGEAGSRALPMLPAEAFPARNGSLGPGDGRPDRALLSPGGTRRLAGGLSGSSSMHIQSGWKQPRSVRRVASNASSEASSSRRDYFRPAGGKHSNLADWAPKSTPVYNDRNVIENLPNWNTLRAGEPTSKPIAKIEKEMDWSVRQLLNENIFGKLLEDPLGRHRFRDFLQAHGEEQQLDFYYDLSQYQVQTRNMREITEALHDLYLAEDSDTQVDLPDQFSDDLYDGLKKAYDVQVALDPVREHLRQSLFKDQFQRFIRSMLIEQNRVKLGSFADHDDDEDYSGLGDSFVLSNPRAGSENPLVLVSPGFVEVTGYPTRSIIGRNCRFLQGPGTAPESVQRIRDALNAGRPVSELLLNYRRDGTPFFCLLSIVPLRDATGQLAYYLGGQVNVSGTLAASKGLGFLTGSTGDDVPEPQTHLKNGLEISPLMARHLASMSGAMGSEDLSSVVSATASSLQQKRRQRGAAGSYDPSASQGPKDERFYKNAQNQRIKMGNSKSPRSSSNSIHGGQERGGGGGIMGRLFGRKSNSSSSQVFVGGPQRLLGAEGVMRSAAPGRLTDQMNFFSDLYSRLLVFKTSKREIIFATQPLLEAFGLPVETERDVYDSALLHADILSLMQGANKGETRALRQAVKDAVRQGRHISLMTGLKMPRTGFGKYIGGDNEDDIITYRALHLTPLHDRDSSSFAYIALLG